MPDLLVRGTDTQYRDISFTWSGSDLIIRICGIAVRTINSVTAIRIDSHRDDIEETENHLLNISSAGGRRAAFFLYGDRAQSSLREIRSNIVTIGAAFKWLLPRGGVARQGDIAVYLSALPARTIEIASENYEEAFAGILGRTHRIENPSRCRFFSSNGKYFISVQRKTRLIHAQHPAVMLPRRSYLVRKARGIPISPVRLRMSLASQLEL